MQPMHLKQPKWSACAFFALLLFCADARITRAETSVVSNTINVTSQSGGNTAQNGSVHEGSVSSQASIITRYDGKTVFEKNIESTSSSISLTSVVTDENGSTSVSVETKKPVQTETLPSIAPHAQKRTSATSGSALFVFAGTASSGSSSAQTQKATSSQSSLRSDRSAGGSVSIFGSFIHSCASVLTYVFKLFSF